MQVILGIIFHTIGGISSGSFYMPFNKVKPPIPQSKPIKYVTFLTVGVAAPMMSKKLGIVS